MMNRPLDDEFSLELLEVRGRPWPLTDWLFTRELTRRTDGNDFWKSRKKWFFVKNIEGIEVVLERIVKEKNMLRDQKYKLIREFKKGGKTVESGVIVLDEDDGGNPS